MNPNRAFRSSGAARIHRFILKLYPYALIRRHGEEMIEILEKEWGRARSGGAASQWRHGLRLAWDIFRTAPVEWAAACQEIVRNRETPAMKIAVPSRRQDLLVGSLVSALLLFAAARLGTASTLSAARPPPDPVARPFILPPYEEPPPESQEADSSKPLTPQEPGPPQQQDYPQIPRPDSFPQPMEPPAAKTDIDTKIIVPPHQPGTGRDVTVFDPLMLDQQPVPQRQVRPQYPADLRRQGAVGTVLVDFIVDSNGDVRNASALRSTNGGFESSAVTAVLKWKFRAGRKAGHAVSTHMQVPIDFILDGN